MAGLLSPLEVKNLRLKNRVVMPPLANNMATGDGRVTPALIDHYLARARAQVGLIVVEHSYVAPSGKFTANQLGVYEDEVIPGLKDLVARVHEAGARIGIQITHGGSRADAAAIKSQPLAPSALVSPRGGEMPRELTREEIGGLVEAFASAALRVKQAGFDMVEVHGAHGYLLNQFFSPLTNRRTDEYGGSRDNRLRFPLEVVQAVRKAVGPDFVVFYRLGADDLMPGGLELADGQWAAPRLVEAGVDVIDLSGGHGGYLPHNQKGFFVYLAEGIKPVVQVPVMVTGGISDPLYADSLIKEGKADLVGIGRSLLKDPHWAEKAIQQLS